MIFIDISHTLGDALKLKTMKDAFSWAQTQWVKEDPHKRKLRRDKIERLRRARKKKEERKAKEQNKQQERADTVARLRESHAVKK